MKELITNRVKGHEAERDRLTATLVDFYARADFLACDDCDRAAMEARHEIPQVRRKIWELQRRIKLLEGCLVQTNNDAILDYLELMDGAAMQYLEKGLSEKATQLDFLEFLGRGFDCDECRNVLQSWKIVTNFKDVTTTLRAKREARETRENARKGA